MHILNTATRLLLFLSIILSASLWLSSCDEEDMRILVMEETLPGKWSIDTFVMPGYGEGIVLGNDTIYHDTVLYNIGEVHFPFFTLAYTEGMEEIGDLYFDFNQGMETATFRIERLFMSGDEYFCYFRYPNPVTGTSDFVNFVNTSHIFNYNAYIKVINKNQIQFIKASGNKDHIMYLTKKQ